MKRIKAVFKPSPILWFANSIIQLYHHYQINARFSQQLLHFMC